ncbi:TPA: N-acetylmuramoyl-L-alanine amidase [Streptococcus suis]
MMVKRINTVLMDAGPLVSIDGVVIHNDAGSGTPEWYVDWLRNREKSLGIAHYYITKDTIARVIDTDKIGYHTGDWPSNQRYIGYEVCQSMSASDADFLANENMTLMQAAEDLQYYGLPINENTVRLHHEFVPTTCPHRSMALHGNSTESVKQYFISRIKHFAGLGKTVDEMLSQTSENDKKTNNNNLEEVDMITISAPGRGIAFMMGGEFLPILDAKTPTILWNQGIKHINLDQKTFDAWQNKVEKSTLDDATVNKLIKGLK